MKNCIRMISALLLTLMLAVPALAVRVNISAQVPTVGTGGTVTANAADVTMTAADATNFQETPLTGREVIICQNTDAGAQTVTFTSVADSLGRTGNITAYSIGAGEIAMFGPFPLHGWKQSNGKLYFQASNAAVKFAVIRVPVQ